MSGLDAIPAGVALFACAALAGCVAAYQPAQIDVPLRLPNGAFERVLRVVQLSYPSVEADRERFRIQSIWLQCEDRGQPAQRRLTLYLDRPGVVSAVVEVRYLSVDLFGNPEWSGIRAHPRWEREMLEAVQQALEAP